MMDSYNALFQSLLLAKTKVEDARVYANECCERAHLAETDYAHSLRELERIEAELKWFRKMEAKAS